MDFGDLGTRHQIEQAVIAVAALHLNKVFVAVFVVQILWIYVSQCRLTTTALTCNQLFANASWLTCTGHTNGR